MTLSVERAEAFRIDALDLEPRDDRRRQRADDGVGPELLAGGERDTALAVDTYGRDLRAESHPLSELQPDPLGHLGAPLHHLERLPALVAIELTLADSRRLA